MNTAELKEIINQRTPEERNWMAAYLMTKCFQYPRGTRRRRNQRHFGLIGEQPENPIVRGVPSDIMFVRCCGDWSTIHGDNPTRIFGLQTIGLVL